MYNFYYLTLLGEERLVLIIGLHNRRAKITENLDNRGSDNRGSTVSGKYWGCDSGVKRGSIETELIIF